MMKKLLLLSILVPFLSSCDILWPPGGGGNGDDTATKLKGTWVWVRTEGGFFPQVHTPQSTGSSATLELKSMDKYTFEQKFNIQNVPDLEDFGSYKLGELNGEHTLQLSSMMARPFPIYSLALSHELNYIKFHGNDTLELRGVGADMFNYTYVRAR